MIFSVTAELLIGGFTHRPLVKYSSLAISLCRLAIDHVQYKTLKYYLLSLTTKSITNFNFQYKALVRYKVAEIFNL